MATLREYRAFFGGRFWTMAELKSVTGLRDARTVNKSLGLDGLAVTQIGRQKRYWGNDIAKRLYDLQEG